MESNTHRPVMRLEIPKKSKNSTENSESSTSTEAKGKNTEGNHVVVIGYVAILGSFLAVAVSLHPRLSSCSLCLVSLCYRAISIDY